MRSNTNVYLVYMEGIVYPELVAKIEERLDGFEIDGVLDSGVIEHLSEEKWYSPFPQFQTTERPDRAAMSILTAEWLCCRTIRRSRSSCRPITIPLSRRATITITAGRSRALSGFALSGVLFAMTLPGLYLAVTNFHTQILPTTLLLSFADARSGVPFPAVIEVIIMELSFELLREAGVRLPGAMGNTIGIVGGLIIGQAAVEANLVSPIVVIVISFTALCSFAVPKRGICNGVPAAQVLFLSESAHGSAFSDFWQGCLRC